MEQVIRPLLVLHLTGSPLLVGAVVAARTLPQLVFGLFAGVIADRYDKRRVLMYTQTVTFLTHVTLAVLLLSGAIAVWHVFVTAMVAGAATSFIQPARQSLLPRLVPREDLLNALALNSAAMSLMRVAGAGLAGLLLVFFDYGQVYLVNALVYAGIIATTVRIQVPKSTGDGRRRGTMLGDLTEGFGYVRSNRTVLYLILTILALFVFGQPYQQVFVPLLAVDVLEVGRSGAGGMLALTGLGALMGSLVVASRRDVKRRGVIMFGVLVVFSVTLIVLAQSRWAPLSFGALILAGAMSTTYMSLNNSLLLGETPPEFHGRVMSLLSLDRGLVSLGAVFSGALAEAFGPQAGLTVLALCCLGFTTTMFVALPTMRRVS
jgi:MFS family permease